MYNLTWSASEKKLSRRLFDAALEAELAEVMAEFKAKAASATTPQDMWDVQEFLARKGREIDEKYDYRHSQLVLVFAKLIREGRLKEEQLECLAEEKLSFVARLLSL